MYILYYKMTTKQYEWENTGFLESIQFEKKKDIIYLTRHGNPLTLTTPELRLPFGLDNNRPFSPVP